MSPEATIPAPQAPRSPAALKQAVKEVVCPAWGGGVHRAGEAGRFSFGDFLFRLCFIDSGVMWGSSCLPGCCRKRGSPQLLCFCLVSSHSLKMRTFSTFDFYRKHEDAMTPAGLAFFQCQWDSSVTWVFHQLLSKKRSVQGCWRGPVCGLGHSPAGNAQGQ